MSLGGNFTRTVNVWSGRFRNGGEYQNYLASEAQNNIAKLISEGRASPLYRNFTNGQEDAPYNTIHLDGTGNIIALFSSMAPAAAFALDYAINHSPRGATGKYRESWVLLVNGRPYGQDADVATLFRDIPLGTEVILTNFLKYHRRIDVGGMKISVPPLITEQVRQQLIRRFPALTVERKFITLPGGYILKGRGRRSGLAYDKKTKRFYQRHQGYVSDEKDRGAGAEMTYPSVVMSERI